MLKRSWRSFLQKIAMVGGEFHDADLRTQKIVLMMLSISAVPLGFAWTIIELTVGETQDGVISGAIATLILVNFLFYVLGGNYKAYRFSQLFIFLIFPFILHVSVGGYTKSANLVWGMATPLIALLSSRPRESLPWFLGFLALILASGVIDPLLWPESGMSISTVFFEFSFNVANIAIIVYLMLRYFLQQKNQTYELLRVEKEKSESLLLNVLPKEIAPILKAGNQTIAERFEEASVLFADIVGFTPLSAQMSPEKMVKLLNQIFSHFDALVEKHDLEKIRTIGDNYMVAAGVPRPRSDHAQAIASLALEMIDYIDILPPQEGAKIEIRVGINSGPLVAGVIGRHKFHYDVWGDPVNIASRMESQGVAGKIQITAATRRLIQDCFQTERRGVVEIKGKGEMPTWFLSGQKRSEADPSSLPTPQTDR